MKKTLLVAVALVHISQPYLEGAEDRGAAIVVRIYNYADVSAEDLATARATGDLIFKRAGIVLAWTDCRVTAHGSGGACTEPLNEGREFLVRLMEDGGGGTSAERLTLGISMLDRQRQSGVLITVDPRLVRTIAEGTSSDRGVLLGRAIAHELGHLLLGRANHARFGLMRGYWSRDELLRARAADWQFTGSEEAQMRRDVLGRMQAAN